MNSLNETHGIGAHAGSRSSSAKALPPPRTRRHIRLGWVPRVISVVLALCMLWSFVAAPAAAAIRAKGPQPVRPHSLPLSPAQAIRLAAQARRVAAMQRRAQGHLFPYRQANAARALRPLPRRGAPAAPLTILSDVGQLAHVVPAAQAAAWDRELAARRPAPARAAFLHLWLGEYQLAHNQQPETALAHFQAAQRLTRPADPVYGAAAYDRAMAFYSEGAYADAATAFRHLLTLRPRLSGFDPRSAALWLRHAGACAGYHADRARAGVPEPDRLDPLCGAAALAASLRRLGSPSSKKTLLAHMHVTGEGSSVGDVVNAARTLGANARTVRADDQGLRMLPKPLVAYVEHDHFVSVVRADSKGVSYLCSDCGPWPGGRVDLTWRQWRLLEGGLYVAVTRPGSAPDRQLAALSPAVAPPRLSLGLTPPVTPAPMRLAAAFPLPGLTLRPLFPLPFAPRLGALLSAPLPALRDHVVLTQQVTRPNCGFRNYSNQCPPMTCCLTAGAGPGGVGGGSGGAGGGSGGAGTGPQKFKALAAASGPTQGDPVNLATGEEEYRPAPDLEVYNPHGPSVSWGRLYNSLRHNGQGFYELDRSTLYVGAFDYEMNDFGQDWSTPYNVGVSDPYPGYCGTSYPKSVFFDNGAHVPFVLPAPPTASAPQVLCQPVSAGVPFLIYADYGAAGTTYSVVFSDRTQWVTTTATSITGSQGGTVYPLGRIVDRTGHALTFHYGPAAGGNLQGQPFQWPLLASITNDDGTALLTVARVGDGSGAVAAVSDCYGRSVLYHVGQYANYSAETRVPGLPAGEVAAGELDHVSQVVPTGAASAPDRYAYGYQDAQDSGWTYLHTISVPNPAGTAPLSTATIDYAIDLTVADIRDGSGNSVTFASVAVTSNTNRGTGDPGSPSAPDGYLLANDSQDSNYTQVTYSGAGQSYSYVAGYDMNMSGALQTDGNMYVTMSRIFDASSPDPYRPTSETDGNGNTTQMTWDQYGNLLTETPPASAARTPAGTTNTYSYANFALGELVSTRTGTKTPTSYAYYEPSGLVQTVTGPRPGTAGAAPIPLASYAYDGLGNVTSVTRPGPNSTAGNTGTYVTTAMNYTSDGSYSQADSLGQPLTVTDPLGHVTHLRYDARGNTTATMDALGNETDFTFNIDDRPLSTLYPATGQSGGGRGSTLNAYLYEANNDPAQQYGPLASVQTFDEGNTAGAFRTVSYSYGPEGEATGVSGSTEAVSYQYDALYRLTGLTDGGGHTTHYFYNQQGYLYQTAYPGAGSPSAPLAAGTADTVTYTGYDNDGDVTGRVDGNATTTTYTYADPESRLTGIHYAPGSGVASLADTSYAYDQYGRRSAMTDGTGQQSYAYDDGDRLTADTTTYAGLPARTISYAFDPDGSRATMSTPAGGFSYGYDAAGRETALTNPFEAYSYSFTYLNNNWLAQSQSSNVLQAAYTYDARGQVTDLNNHRTDSLALSDFAVPSSGGYDGAGDRTALAASLPAAPGYSGSTAYAYDSRNELTGETSSRNGGYGNVNAYDGAENPTTFRNNAVGSASADNQLPGVSYDGDGAPKSCKGTSVTYGPEGRAVNFSGLVASAYTGDGLRGVKYAGGYTYFLYDGEQPVCELNSAGAVTATNTFGPNGLLSRHTASGSALYTWDMSGNLAQRENTGGGTIDSAVSDGFGASTTTDNSPDPFSGFGGQWGGYTDAAQAGQTGLTLFTHRFYDSSTGRFLTRDPLGYRGGVNLYGYTQNDPTNRNDPSGYEGHPWWEYCEVNGEIIGGAGGVGTLACMAVPGAQPGVVPCTVVMCTGAIIAGVGGVGHLCSMIPPLPVGPPSHSGPYFPPTDNPSPVGPSPNPLGPPSG